MSIPSEKLGEVLNGKRVLVVNENIVSRRATIFSLQSQRSLCEVAHADGDAIRLLNSTTYDLVVLGVDSYRTGRHPLLKEILGRQERPAIIVVTDELEAGAEQDLKSQGVEAVCFNPIEAKRFAAVAGDAISASKDRSNRELLARVEQADAENSTREQNKLSVNVDSSAGRSHAEDISNSELETQDEFRVMRGGFVSTDGNLTKAIVVILLQNQDRAMTMASALASETVIAVPLPGSDDLYRQLSQERADVVVIDQKLNGFLSGIEMLERLYNDLVRPETVLLASPDDGIKQRAKLLELESVIDPSCATEEIVATVRDILQRELEDETAIPITARRVVQRNGDIPPVPQLLLKMLNYLEQDAKEISLPQLTADISVDPKATADLLKLTNSSSLGLRHAPTNVLDAIKLVGPQRAISLILSSATITAQSNLLKEKNEAFREWYYQRSVLVANTAAVFAEKIESISGATAFVLGLLQDVGILVLASNFPQRYEQIFQRARTAGRSELSAMEHDDFGMTHADVSAALLQKWDLPASLIRLVHSHHRESVEGELSIIEDSFLRVVQIGEALADLSDVAHPARREKLNRRLSHYGSDIAAQSGDLFAEAIAKTAESCELFKLPTPDSSIYELLLQQVANRTHSHHLARELVGTGG